MVNKNMLDNLMKIFLGMWWGIILSSIFSMVGEKSRQGVYFYTVFDALGVLVILAVISFMAIITYNQLKK